MAVIFVTQLLQEVNTMGHDKQFVCQKPAPKSDQLLMNVRSPQAQDGGSSDEEEEEEEIGVTGATAGTQEAKDSASGTKGSQSASDTDQ